MVHADGEFTNVHHCIVTDAVQCLVEVKICHHQRFAVTTLTMTAMEQLTMDVTVILVIKSTAEFQMWEDVSMGNKFATQREIGGSAKGTLIQGQKNAMGWTMIAMELSQRMKLTRMVMGDFLAVVIAMITIQMLLLG